MNINKVIFNNYTKYISALNIYNSNSVYTIYNSTYLKKKINKVLLSTNYNSFSLYNKSAKLYNSYFLLHYLSFNKPSLKRVKFTNIRKQILKTFIIESTVRNKSLYNFINFIFYYLYVYNIFYIQDIKYMYNNKLFSVLFDNLHMLLNTSNKQSKSQLKITFDFEEKGKNIDSNLYYLLNFYYFNNK